MGGQGRCACGRTAIVNLLIPVLAVLVGVFFLGVPTAAIESGPAQPEGEQVAPRWSIAIGADVSVTASPNPVTIDPGGYGAVTYTFTERNSCAVTIRSRTGRFFAPNLEPLTSVIGPYANSIAIPAGGRATWTDNLYLPPEVARAASERGYAQVLLEQTFHGIDCSGRNVETKTLLVVRFSLSSSPQQGAIRFLLEPSAAREAGAQWRLTSGPDTNWKNSGDTISGLPAGTSYNVNFRQITGWNAPPPFPDPIRVEAGTTVTRQGTYTPAGRDPVARVTVNASPNPVSIPPGQYAVVRYTFTAQTGMAVTLNERTGQFLTPDGTPLTAESSRMSQNIVVPAMGTTTWDDNTYMPPDMAAEASRRGHSSVILRERFYGRDAQGATVSVSVDLTIVFATPGGTARLSVSASPNPVTIEPGGAAETTYSFRETGGCAVTITSRTTRFYTPDGAALTPSIGPLSNDIRIPANGSASWLDTPVLPVLVAGDARRRGFSEVILRQAFHGTDCRGGSVTAHTDLLVSIPARQYVMPTLRIPEFAPLNWVLPPGWSGSFYILVGNDGSADGTVWVEAVAGGSAAQHVTLQWRRRELTVAAHDSASIRLEISVSESALLWSGDNHGWVRVTAGVPGGPAVATLEFYFSVARQPWMPNTVKLDTRSSVTHMRPYKDGVTVIQKSAGEWYLVVNAQGFAPRQDWEFDLEVQYTHTTAAVVQ